MTNFKKKAIPAVMLLAGATASLGGVTYAWFTSNAKVSASNINLGIVDSSGGIQIAKELNSSYQAELDFDSETKGSTSGSKTVYPHTLNPLSAAGILSGDSNADKVLTFYSATVDPANGNNLISSAKVETADKGYWKLDLYFENTTKFQQKIFFDYDADEAKAISSFFSTHTFASESIRLAFINQGTATHKTDPISYKSDPGFVMVEPDDKNHLDTAYVYTEDAEGKRTEVPYVSPVPAKDPRHIKQDTWGIKDVINSSTPMRPTKEEEKTITTLQKQVTKNLAETDIDTDGATPLFTLAANCYSKISIFIWLEGNDCDCLDSTAGAPIALSLKFAAKQVTA